MRRGRAGAKGNGGKRHHRFPEHFKLSIDCGIASLGRQDSVNFQDFIYATPPLTRFGTAHVSPDGFTRLRSRSRWRKTARGPFGITVSTVETIDASRHFGGIG